MARYIIDANLPRWFGLWSSNDYEFVHDLGPNWTDTEVWDYAATKSLTIVSKDADFSDRVMLTRQGPRVIHVRIGNRKMADFHQLLARVWGEVCRASEESRLVQLYWDRIESL